MSNYFSNDDDDMEVELLDWAGMHTAEITWTDFDRNAVPEDHVLVLSGQVVRNGDTETLWALGEGSPFNATRTWHRCLSVP